MAKYTDELTNAALDGADLFLRNRANAKPTPLNENDKEVLLEIAKICREAFDLINRQEAEIERLNNDIARLMEKNRLACQCTPKAIRRAKSEAIKEFAERLCEGRVENAPVVIAAKCLVKEMVGEGE